MAADHVLRGHEVCLALLMHGLRTGSTGGRWVTGPAGATSRVFALTKSGASRRATGSVSTANACWTMAPCRLRTRAGDELVPAPTAGEQQEVVVGDEGMLTPSTQGGTANGMPTRFTWRPVRVSRAEWRGVAPQPPSFRRTWRAARLVRGPGGIRPTQDVTHRACASASATARARGPVRMASSRASQFERATAAQPRHGWVRACGRARASTLRIPSVGSTRRRIARRWQEDVGPRRRAARAPRMYRRRSRSATAPTGRHRGRQAMSPAPAQAAWALRRPAP